MCAQCICMMCGVYVGVCVCTVFTYGVCGGVGVCVCTVFIYGVCGVRGCLCVHNDYVWRVGCT